MNDIPQGLVLESTPLFGVFSVIWTVGLSIPLASLQRKPNCVVLSTQWSEEMSPRRTMTALRSGIVQTS